MTADKLAGILPVLAAPFDDNGKVDYDGLRSLVDFQIRTGAAGVALFGFATEFYKLAETEKMKMLRVVKETAGDRFPVVTSVTEQATELAVWKAREMEDNGADALMILPPFMIPAGKDSFIRHVHEVAKVVSIPIIVQYSPAETGIALEGQSLVEMMAEYQNLKFLKIECKPPGPMITKVLTQKNISYDVFVGYAGLQMIDALKRGAVGVMPGSSLTDIYCGIYKLFKSGQVQKAMAAHGNLLPILNYIFQSIEMIIKWEKVILKRRGIIKSDYCRYPGFIPDSPAFNLFDEYYAKLAANFKI